MFQVSRVLHCGTQSKESEEKSKSLISYLVTVPSGAHWELVLQCHPFILLFFFSFCYRTAEAAQTTLCFVPKT